jgi:hypothetical protein
LDTIASWTLALDEVPDAMLAPAYTAALDAHTNPAFLVNAIEVRNAYRALVPVAPRGPAVEVDPLFVAGFEARSGFVAEHGRQPSADELRALVLAWAEGSGYDSERASAFYRAAEVAK